MAKATAAEAARDEAASVVIKFVVLVVSAQSIEIQRTYPRQLVNMKWRWIWLRILDPILERMLHLR
jgi:hypothetical protein